MLGCLQSYMFEIYIVLRIASQIFSQIGIHFLIQDKICLNDYNQSQAFCQKINEIQDDDPDSKLRDRILAQAVNFTTFHSLADFLPMFVWILFIGSFLDRNKNATKWILYLHIIADSLLVTIFQLNAWFFHLSVYWNLIGAFTTALSGGSSTFMTVCYRFLAVTSVKKNRAIRLMLCQFGLAGGAAVGALASGFLLHPNDLSQSHTFIRTYHFNFGASLLVNAICVPLLIIALRRGDRLMLVVKAEEAEDEAREAQEKGLAQPEMAKTKANESQEENKEFRRGFLYELFDIDNVKSTWNCLRQRRPNRINISIYAIYACYFLLYFAFIGIDNVTLQFFEKVYNWNAKQYSTVSAIYRVAVTAITVVGVVVFVKKLTVEDSKIVTVAAAVTTIANLIVGLILRDVVYFIVMPLLACCGMIFVCLRNKLAGMVKTDEMGRIFSVVELIMSSIPFLSALAYSKIFSASVSTVPGIVYQFTGVLYGAIFVIVMFEQFWCSRGFWTGRNGVQHNKI